MRESLLHVISRLEAALDFSEEGYEFITRDDARREIERAIADTRGAGRDVSPRPRDDLAA